LFILSGQLQVVAHSGRISAMNPLVAFYVEHNMLKKVNNATEFVSIKFKGIKMNVTNLYNFFVQRSCYVGKGCSGCTLVTHQNIWRGSCRKHPHSLVLMLNLL
jgi:hypothetical protein